MKSIKRKTAAFCLIAVLLCGSACGALTEGNGTAAQDAADVPEQRTEIRLETDHITATGEGVSIDGTTVSIKQAGEYFITGMLDNGQIYVNAGGDDLVVLSLGGIEISNTEKAAIYVENAGLTRIVAEAGTVNRVQSGAEIEIDTTGQTEADETVSGGAIYAGDDLAVTGDGTLQVFGYLNNGIQTANNLSIENGILEVSARNNAVKGKDSVSITGGLLTLISGGDAIKSDDTTGEGYGIITISDGTFVIKAGGDGIQAETQLAISGGVFDIQTGGGSEMAPIPVEAGGGMGMPAGMNRDEMGERPERPEGVLPGDATGERPGRVPGELPPEDMMPQDMAPPTEGTDGMTPPEGLEEELNWDREDENSISQKGLKSGGDLHIDSGAFSIDSCDDSIHANGSITIAGGTFELSSGDDGVHADVELNVENGIINILRSYEGLEANQICISGGDISIVATDDGVNANGGQSNWSSAVAANEELPCLYLDGGTLAVDAGGDGLDSNGSIVMNGGTVVVDGPSSGANSALDCGTENGGICVVNGGAIFAIGSSGMMEGVGSESEQPSFIHNFEEMYAAGSEIVISDASGMILFQHTAAKSGTSVVFSCPSLTLGERYILSVDGNGVEIELDDISTASGQSTRWGR